MGMNAQAYLENAKTMGKTVPAKETIRAMLDETGVSTYMLSKRLHRSPNWAWNMMRHDTKLSTLTRMAEVLGLKIAILSADDKIVAVIEPEPEVDAG